MFLGLLFDLNLISKVSYIQTYENSYINFNKSIKCHIFN